VPLDKPIITSKCVEISKSLLNTSVGFFGYDLGTSRIVGDLARFAVSIKQSGEIPREQFAGISTALKIDYNLAEGARARANASFNFAYAFSHKPASTAGTRAGTNSCIGFG